MPKFLPLRGPKRSHSLVVIGRSPQSGFTLRLVRDEDGSVIASAFDLALLDVITKVRALEADPRELNQTIDDLLVGKEECSLRIELTDAQAAAFVRKNV